MPYDLYGNYYSSHLEASNAEMAQCAEIDAQIVNQKISELQRHLQQPEEEISHLWQYMQGLEERIKSLESKINTDK